MGRGDGAAAVRRPPGRFSSGTRGAASQQADADAVEPSVGARLRGAVAKVLAEFHPEPSEDVPALVAGGDGACAPPEAARGDLDDGLVSGRGPLKFAEGRMDDEELQATNDAREQKGHTLAVLAVPVVGGEQRAAADSLPALRRDGDVRTVAAMCHVVHAAVL